MNRYSKRLLRSDTCVRANIAGAEYGIIKDDFKAKMYIAQKNCNGLRQVVAIEESQLSDHITRYITIVKNY